MRWLVCAIVHTVRAHTHLHTHTLALQIGGAFRALAAIARSTAPIARTGARTLQSARPLAFSSEVRAYFDCHTRSTNTALPHTHTQHTIEPPNTLFCSQVGVAAQTLLPRSVYLGSWALSGVAVLADAGLHVVDAPEGKKLHMVSFFCCPPLPAQSTPRGHGN